MNEEFDEIDFKSKLNFKLWIRLFKIATSEKKPLLVGIISVILLELNETIFVWFLSEKGFGKFIERQETDGFITFVIVLAVMTIIEGILVKLFVYGFAKLEMHIYRTLTEGSFNHLQELSYSFFDKYSVGWLMSRVTSDTSRVSEIISWGVTDLISCSCKLIFILIIMIITNVKLSLVMLIVVPVAIVFSFFFERLVMKASWKERKRNSAVSSALNEGISASKTSKSLVLEEKNLERFNGIVSAHVKAQIKTEVLSGCYYQILSILFGCGITAMAYFGARQYLNDTISYATLFMFVQYAMQFFDPVLGVAQVSNQMKQAQVAAERVFRITDIKPDLIDTPEVIEKYGTLKEPKKENYENIKGDVEFKDVSFRYNADSRLILDTFNLKVKAGSSVALVGETGAGKSTIVNLLCRFYEPTTGEIKIDGVDYKKRSIGWLHDNLGYVMQTPHLFSGTIMENIRYGRLDATDDEVIAAAKAANAHSFIGLLEKGYNTEVGEGGNLLSQGQKQLISFARAILADPRILILDEATSSIDTETEFVIQKAIANILKNRTSFVIAHRLSTITSSDLILVIQHGEVTEKGTHEELMKLKGYYYKLYTNQFIENRLKEINIL